jgi:hypothetical protein
MAAGEEGMQVSSAREQARLQRIIDAQARELDHRAEVISSLADRLAEAHADLDLAVSLGREHAIRSAWMRDAEWSFREGGAVVLTGRMIHV